MAVGLQFLAPNILTFLAFTILPVVFSLVMAFSNYDLLRHNRFHHSSLQFPTWENFSRLFADPDFWTYFGNTLFFLLAVPIGIAASLLAALALNLEPNAGSKNVRVVMIAVSVFITGIAALLLAGAKTSAMICLLTLLPCGVLVLGAIGGASAYRTLFYIPSFTSGVAVFIVWAKLYNPHVGPINSALAPSLRTITWIVNTLPPYAPQIGFWVCLLLAGFVLAITIRRLRLLWNDGDLGIVAAIALVLLLVMSVGIAVFWLPTNSSKIFLTAEAAIVVAWYVGRSAQGPNFKCPATSGGGGAGILVAGSICAQFIFVGLGIVLFYLRANAAQGLEPPSWLTQYYWAKPALMLMGLWAAIGSNNMLLYLAALSNMPAELYEAADIDGAGRLSKFWNVTWPQLAPTTFLIAITSIIGGLQGGFDSARAMTDGGPAGSTTTLAYYIYSQGFLSGHLGYASAIAWVMFLMILVITVVNWKWGSQNVND